MGPFYHFFLILPFSAHCFGSRKLFDATQIKLAQLDKNAKLTPPAHVLLKNMCSTKFITIYTENI